MSERFESSFRPSSQAPPCAVCGAARGQAQTVVVRPAARPVCDSRRCHSIASLGASVPDAAWDSFVRGQLSIWESKERARDDYQEQLRARGAAERDESIEYLRERPKRLGGHAIRELPVLLIPRNARRLTELPAERRDTYRKHIEDLVARVLDPNHSVSEDLVFRADEPGTTTDSRLAAHACTFCGGDCCGHGGDRAYVDANTVQRVAQAHPEWGPKELAAVWLDRVPQLTYEGACVNQGPRGCVLPREHRATICNEHFCPPMKEFVEQLEAKPGQTQAAVVVGRPHPTERATRESHENPIDAWAVITPEEIVSPDSESGA
ncbi:MAG: hypothetical protein AAF517_20225 [Planctomycetota bacterium]